MKRALLVTSMALTLGVSTPAVAAPPKPSAAEPAPANSLAPLLEKHVWGMSQAALIKLYTETNGILWKEYDERLAKARVGPEMTAIEHERDTAKDAFIRSVVEFRDTPTGYDATGIRGEYTYKNRESLMSLQRKGRKRYFFFINDKLWKVYDEVALGQGGLGGSYSEVVAKFTSDLGAPGRSRPASKDLPTATTDWKDGPSHLRVLDRSGEGLVGVVLEDNATLNNLPALRANKEGDKFAIDPTVASVTNGANRTDPNAAKEAPPAATKPKKKK